MVEQAALRNGMFADSLLETSWSQCSRRSLTTLTSFGVQAVAIGALLLIPLLTNVVLPDTRILPTPVSWGTPAASQHIQRQRPTVVVSNLSDNRLIEPVSIPPHVRMIDETTAPPQINYNEGDGVEGAVVSGSKDGVLSAINSPTSRETPVLAPPPAVSRVFRSSTLLQGSLIRQVQPAYPPLARSARIEGSVVLAAVISKDGTIQNLQLISGHPMLVHAALQAVSQWRYKPYVLNGEPIEVETRITVNFVLSRD